MNKQNLNLFTKDMFKSKNKQKKVETNNQELFGNLSLKDNTSPPL
jgi:hypothetical protein